MRQSKTKFTKEDISAIATVNSSKPIGKELKRISRQLGRSIGSVTSKYYELRNANARKVYIPRQQKTQSTTTYNFKNVKSVDIDGNSVRIIV